MSDRDRKIFENGECPHCLKPTIWMNGPKGGLSTNLKCVRCKGEICESPVLVEKIFRN